MIYAFVDVETTGFSADSDRIIEIAIVRYENGTILDTYQTLVNPETYVSPYIQDITGIDPLLLQTAPTFSDIAGDVLDRFEDATMVAHNAGFDYGFLKKEFKRLQHDFRPNKLCTVQLSRTLYPQYSRHGLDQLIERFHLDVPERHRALDDVLATIQFFAIAQRDAGEEYFSATLKCLTRTAQLPPNISMELVNNLPQTSGVYLFYGENGHLLYVGKSTNIRQRVKDHFYIEDPNALKFLQEIRDITYEVTAGEIGALIRESQLIKERLPLFNKQLRRQKELVIARQKFTPEGYKIISLANAREINPEEISEIVGLYRSKKQAKEHFAQLLAEHKLCDSLMGLQSTRGSCFGYHLHRCKGACIGEESTDVYNAKVDSAFQGYALKAWPYSEAMAITEFNPEYDMSEVHVIDKWCYIGSASSIGELEDMSVSKLHFEYDIYKILLHFIQRHPSHLLPLRNLRE